MYESNQFRETNDKIPSKIVVEIAFSKQMIITGAYTAWNVTKLSYALNENDALIPILDDNLFWSGFEKDDEDRNSGKKCRHDFLDNLLIFSMYQSIL